MSKCFQDNVTPREYQGKVCCHNLVPLYMEEDYILPWALSPYQSLAVCFKILVNFTCDNLRHLFLGVHIIPHSLESSSLLTSSLSSAASVVSISASSSFSYVVLSCSHFTNLGMQNLKQIALEYSTVLAWALSL